MFAGGGSILGNGLGADYVIFELGACSEKSGDMARCGKNGDMARFGKSGDMARSGKSGDMAGCVKSGDMARSGGSIHLLRWKHWLITFDIF